MLAGTHPDWLGATQTSRLRATLREITDPADFVARARARAVVHAYTGHPSAIERLIPDMATTDHAKLGLTPNPAERADGYLDAATLNSLVTFLGLREDPQGPITVRATHFDLDVVAGLADETVLAALDAATSLDPRERGVGERALAAVLENYLR